MADEGGTISAALTGISREVLDGSGELLAASGAARVVASLPGLAPGSGFRLDVDAARAAVARLDAALDQMERTVLATSLPMFRMGFGIDPVSVQLERNVALMALRAQAYARVWSDQIRATRDALVAHIEGTAAADRANAERLA